MARPSGQLSMAVLVLLAAAAGARVVAADLGAVAGDRGVGGGVGLGEAGLFGFLVGAEATGVGVLELHLARGGFGLGRSEEHTSELQSLMRSSSAVFCLK